VTVTRAIGSAIVLLLEHPARAAELVANPEIGQRVVEEVLRLESPAQGLFRTVTREVSLGGVTLPAGARVMAHFGSANRDEAVWDGAGDFRPDREGLGRHIAFGKGIHFCIGAPLARLELSIALPRLFARLAGLQVAGQPWEREPIFFARGFRRLEVEWDADSG
jgi:cytochrome P450